jgi:hypothetical protein
MYGRQGEREAVVDGASYPREGGIYAAMRAVGRTLGGGRLSKAIASKEASTHVWSNAIAS